MFTYLLLAANLLVYGIETAGGDPFIQLFALWPIGAGFAPWQPLTSAFLHGGLAHLATNMFGLWMFGRDVERSLGSRRFLLLYFSSVLTASLAQLGVDGLMHEGEPIVGASGGIFGVMTAYAMLFPKRRLMLIFAPVPLPAPVFVTLYAAFELFSGVSGFEAGVAHFAHLGGLVGGGALAWYWRDTRLDRLQAPNSV